MKKEFTPVPFTGRTKNFTDRSQRAKVDSQSVNGCELSLDQEVKSCLERLAGRLGLKNLAEFFDGRDGEAVAKSTVSQWIGGSRHFPAAFLPILVELDQQFRAILFRLLIARMASQGELIAEIAARDPKAAQIAAQAQQEIALRLFRDPQGRLFP